LGVTPIEKIGGGLLFQSFVKNKRIFTAIPNATEIYKSITPMMEHRIASSTCFVTFGYFSTVKTNHILSGKRMEMNQNLYFCSR
jgi:hypothetical protein